MSGLPGQKEMDRAVQKRDASYDGVFFTGVRTTGIFCRPSCSAKTPLPENREYFGTACQAVFAGYRPCKRCRPMHTDGQPPDWVERLLAAVERRPSVRVRDTDVRAMAIDPARARRYFLKHYGMTFQAYCRGRRMSKAFDQIRRGASLDEVALGYGYESESGFRDAFMRTFGRTPGQSRDSDCIVAAWFESPLGPLVAATTREGICLLEFTDRRALEAQFQTLRARFPRPIVPGNHAYLDQLRDELSRYFAGSLREFTTPLVYPGTPFQVKVWNELRRIPYGEAISYEELARRVDCPGAQRAVGRANGMNRIGIVIPCHRVVNKGGKLGGYGGGLWRKQSLLDLERGIRMPNFSHPAETRDRESASDTLAVGVR
jgi:AraC family transcriptional regulator of adaptative response/methylated-DNA-[protein]-cysteine methyltransferase